MSDVLISDTSSTIYEFLLLSRPVITIGTLSKEIYWEDIATPKRYSGPTTMPSPTPRPLLADSGL